MPFGRSNLAQTAVVSVLRLAALMLLGLVLAYWTWTWLGPRPEPRVETSAQPAGRTTAANALFGRATGNPGVDAPTAGPLSLLGVAAATGRTRGYALLRLDARLLAVRAGNEVAPGIRLEEVFADRVVLQRNGARETLALPERGKSARAVAPGTGK